MNLTKDQIRKLYEASEVLTHVLYDMLEAVSAPPAIPAFADDSITLDPPDYTADADWNQPSDTEPPPPSEFAASLDEFAAENLDHVKRSIELDMADAPSDLLAAAAAQSGDMLTGDVLNLLKRSGAKKTAGEIAKSLNAEETKPISRALARLIDAGLVSKEGERRACRYFSIETECRAAE